MGVATLARLQDLETLLANADASLSAAQAGGRDRTALPSRSRAGRELSRSLTLPAI
jgi:hypothetical protein